MHGLSCVGAWEEAADDCNIAATWACSDLATSTSDILCECEERSYAYLGCFADDAVRRVPAALPWDSFTVATATECARRASQGGYKYFAMQNAGQCFAGYNGGYDALGTSTDCTNFDGQGLNVGGPWANAVCCVVTRAPGVQEVTRQFSQFSRRFSWQREAATR